ncbi:MAG: DUF4358 domain-containing protein [Peptococcaceae bacterium]
MKKKIMVFTVLMAMLFLFTACGQKNVQANLLDTLATMEEKLTLPDGLQDITASDLERLYGISSEQYVQFAGKISTVGILGDEIVMIEAGDEDAAASVKEKMEARYQSRLNEMDGYLPDEYFKISNGGVYQKGNYVALLVNEEQDALVEIFEGSFND